MITECSNFREAINYVLDYAYPYGDEVYAMDSFMRSVMLKLERGEKISWVNEVNSIISEFSF